jgi:hypothetical protein
MGESILILINFNNSSKYTCESCSDYTYAHFFLRCVCGKYTCCSCYHQKARCICNLPFSCNSIFTATSRYYEVLRHDCKLERNFLKLRFLDIETLRDISNDSRNRSELVLLKRWLELLQTPNLNAISCRFLVSNIVSISETLGEECSSVFTHSCLNMDNRHFLENIAKASPTTGLVDHTLRTDRHEMFLRIYNKSVHIKKESKISKLLKRISHHGVTFLLFLILCTQIPGVASRELNTIDFHVTQEIVRIDEVYNITPKRGNPKGYAKNYRVGTR